MKIFYLSLIYVFLFNFTSFSQPEVKINPLFSYYGHVDDVNAVAYSFNGKLIATAGFDKKIMIWNADTNTLVMEFPAHNSAIVSLTFSRNNKLLLSTSNDGNAILWDLENKKAIRTFMNRGHRVTSGAISPDTAARFVVIGLSDGNIKIFDKEKKGYDLLKTMEIGAPVNSVSFDNTGRSILVGCNDNSVRLYNPVNSELLRTFEGHTAPVLSVSSSVDGKWFISGSSDRTAIIWNVRSGQIHRTLKGHEWRVQSVAFNARSNYAATASNDGSVLLWEVETGELLTSFKPEGRHNMQGVTFSPDTRFLVSVTRARSITEPGVMVWETGIDLRAIANEKSKPGDNRKIIKVEEDPNNPVKPTRQVKQEANPNQKRP
jgi:WD40 repeat protein